MSKSFPTLFTTLKVLRVVLIRILFDVHADGHIVLLFLPLFGQFLDLCNSAQPPFLRGQLLRSRRRQLHILQFAVLLGRRSRILPDRLVNLYPMQPIIMRTYSIICRLQQIGQTKPVGIYRPDSRGPVRRQYIARSASDISPAPSPAASSCTRPRGLRRSSFCGLRHRIHLRTGKMHKF